MIKGDPVWNNLVAYPDFEVDTLDAGSLFWRIEANHPFYTVTNKNRDLGIQHHSSVAHENGVRAASEKEKGIMVSNYYHEPVVIRNGLWGSRIFLKSGGFYQIGVTYRSNVKLYMGLYAHGSNVPVKNWVLKPNPDDAPCRWEESFSTASDGGMGTDCYEHPLHIKIVVPDTDGQNVELSGLYLRSLPSSERGTEIRENISYQAGAVDDASQNQNKYMNSDDGLAGCPVVAVGIVTYNRKKNIAALLRQMREISYPSDKLKIFVVDNASTDGTDQMIRSEFPEVTLLKNVENLGGAGGFNRFFKHLVHMGSVAPEYGWLIDDDAVIDRNTLIYLMRALLPDDSIAVAGSVMMDLEHPSTVYEAGGDLFSDSFGWRANILHTDAGNLMHVNEKCWNSGYAGAYSLLFRTEVIGKVGIWRDYFLHVDDCEWSVRIQRLTGKRVVIALDSLVWHVLQGSKKPFTVLRYYETRNFLDYFASTGSSRALLKVMVQTTLMGIKQLLIKRGDLCEFHIKGIDDFFSGRFGKQPLERSALFFNDLTAIFEEYRKEKGRYPGKVFIIKEINGYMNDGSDYEGAIIAGIRSISPSTTIYEASAHNGDFRPRGGDRFRSLDPAFIEIPLPFIRGIYLRKPLILKTVLIIRMVKEFFIPSGAVVILPFWNESIIPNNLGCYTAVFENGKYSLYKTSRLGAIRRVMTIIARTLLSAVKILRKRFNPEASHVSF